jgi:hypothetical protein
MVLNIWDIHFVVNELFKFVVKVLLLKDVTLDIGEYFCLSVPKLGSVVS